MLYEEVRDFFYDRHNYIGEIDAFAEQACSDWRIEPGDALLRGLERRPAQAHGVRMRHSDASAIDTVQRGETLRHFDATHRIF